MDKVFEPDCIQKTNFYEQHQDGMILKYSE